MLLHISSGFSIFGLNISFYGLIMAIAFVVAIGIAIYNSKKKDLKSDDILSLALYVVPLSILGARTYYCIFSGQHFTFWQFFEVWNGGLAILGGVIGGVIAVLLYCFFHKKNFFDIACIAAPSLILGQAIGRIGCYFAGCCYGVEILNPSLHFFPIGIQIDGIWHYATMFYECFWCVVGFVVLQTILSRSTKRGETMCYYLVIYGFGRAIIESFRGDSLYLFSTGIRVSQALAILILVAGIIGLILIYTKHKRNEKINNN